MSVLAIGSCFMDVMSVYFCAFVCLFKRMCVCVCVFSEHAHVSQIKHIHIHTQVTVMQAFIYSKPHARTEASVFVCVCVCVCVCARAIIFVTDFFVCSVHVMYVYVVCVRSFVCT